MVIAKKGSLIKISFRQMYTSIYSQISNIKPIKKHFKLNNLGSSYLGSNYITSHAIRYNYCYLPGTGYLLIVQFIPSFWFKLFLYISHVKQKKKKLLPLLKMKPSRPYNYTFFFALTDHTHLLSFSPVLRHHYFLNEKKDLLLNIFKIYSSDLKTLAIRFFFNS